MERASSIDDAHKPLPCSRAAGTSNWGLPGGSSILSVAQHACTGSR